MYEIILQTGCAIVISTILLLDYIIHDRDYISISILVSILIQQVSLMILQFDQALTYNYFAQSFELSTYLWIIILIQRDYLLTKYDYLVVDDYNKQFFLQFLLAIGFPLFAGSLIYFKLNVFWGLMMLAQLFCLILIIYYLIQIDLCYKMDLTFEIFWSSVLFCLHIPWVVYSYILIFSNKEREDQKLIQYYLFLLKNCEVFLVLYLFVYHKKLQCTYLKIVCPQLRLLYNKIVEIELN
ncbi:hypothetical protein pb186bvf_009543 [Paramecium bursaria]